MQVEHINPKGMYESPVFSQGIILSADARLLFIGGQSSVDATGQVIGKNDIGVQTAQALANMQRVLAAAGAGLENLVKITIILQQDADLLTAFDAWMEVWGQRTKPPTVTALRVAGLSNPNFLIEIEAQAVLP